MKVTDAVNPCTINMFHRFATVDNLVKPGTQVVILSNEMEQRILERMEQIDWRSRVNQDKAQRSARNVILNA